MEYALENINFKEDLVYSVKDFWHLFRIYDAYKIDSNCKMIFDLEYSSCVVGEIGVLCFHQKICKCYDEKLFYKKGILLYKMFAGLDMEYDMKNYISILNATSLKELKKFPKVTKEDILYAEYAIKRYIERIKKFIPNNILEKIDNLKIFSLGFIEEDIYNDLIIFKNSLEIWLSNTQKKYLLKETMDLEEFHDMLYNVSYENDELVLISEDIYTPIDISFKNCKILYFESKEDCEEISSKQIMLEGYNYIILKRADGMFEAYLEFIECNLIIEFKCFEENKNK